jgi:hypothetical protein
VEKTQKRLKKENYLGNHKLSKNINDFENGKIDKEMDKVLRVRSRQRIIKICI